MHRAFAAPSCNSWLGSPLCEKHALLAQLIEAGIADDRKKPRPRIRPLHLIEAPKCLKTPVLHRVPGRRVIARDPPREAVTGVQVHKHLLFEPGGPLCIVQSTSSPN